MQHAITRRTALRSAALSTAAENAQLKQQLSTFGLVFDDVDRAEFVEKLRISGYRAQWKTSFGDERSGLLEKYTGKLA